MSEPHRLPELIIFIYRASEKKERHCLAQGLQGQRGCPARLQPAVHRTASRTVDRSAFDPHNLCNVGRAGLLIPVYEGRNSNPRSPVQKHGHQAGESLTSPTPAQRPLLLSPAALGAQWRVFPHPRGNRLTLHTFPHIPSLLATGHIGAQIWAGQIPHPELDFQPLGPIGMFWPLSSYLHVFSFKTRTFRVSVFGHLSLSVVFHSLLLCPWDSLGKNTRVGCHALLQGSSQPRDRIQVSHIAARFFNV